MRDLLSDLEAGVAPVNPMESAQQNMRPVLAKRFYETAVLSQTDNGFSILLDGRSIKTPGRNKVVIPQRRVAEAAVGEWRAQNAEIDPISMPVTRLINSAIDGVEDKKTETLEDIINYVDSDLVCYRADSPEELVIRQNNKWNPVVNWAKESVGITLVLTQGVMPVLQPKDNREKLLTQLVPLDSFELASFSLLVNLTGSAILTLGYAKGQMTSQELWDKAHVDEYFSEERWGVDSEAARAREARQKDFRAAAFILREE